MKKYFAFLILTLFVSCSSSEMQQEYKCNNASFSDLETVSDIRKLFKVKLPKSWKTNLFYDNSQTSIYSADTTKSLTKTVLFDVTMVHNSLKIDDSFLLKLNDEEKQRKYTNVRSKETMFKSKPSYLQHSKGKRGKYSYQRVNLYTKLNSENFLHSKIEVYGDSLVNERICKAIDLLEKIEIE